jgi:hypothetical protein
MTEQELRDEIGFDRDVPLIRNIVVTDIDVIKKIYIALGWTTEELKEGNKLEIFAFYNVREGTYRHI